MKKRKTYSELKEEKQSILDEKENYKNGSSMRKIGFFLNPHYTYFDELGYMLRQIEKEMIPYEILYRLKLYQELYKKIPYQLVVYISKFGDFVDKIACKYLVRFKLQ